jgi:hypothetical protein
MPYPPDGLPDFCLGCRVGDTKTLRCPKGTAGYCSHMGILKQKVAEVFRIVYVPVPKGFSEESANFRKT